MGLESAMVSENFLSFRILCIYLGQQDHLIRQELLNLGLNPLAIFYLKIDFVTNLQSLSPLVFFLFGAERDQVSRVEGESEGLILWIIEE